MSLEDVLRQEKALRDLAKTDPDALAAYRRLVARANVYAGAVNRIASHLSTYESYAQNVDTMRRIANDAIREVEGDRAPAQIGEEVRRGE